MRIESAISEFSDQIVPIDFALERLGIFITADLRDQFLRTDLTEDDISSLAAGELVLAPYFGESMEDLRLVPWKNIITDPTKIPLEDISTGVTIDALDQKRIEEEKRKLVRFSWLDDRKSYVAKLPHVELNDYKFMNACSQPAWVGLRLDGSDHFRNDTLSAPILTSLAMKIDAFCNESLRHQIARACGTIKNITVEVFSWIPDSLGRLFPRLSLENTGEKDDNGNFIYNKIHAKETIVIGEGAPNVYLKTSSTFRNKDSAIVGLTEGTGTVICSTGTHSLGRKVPNAAGRIIPVDLGK